MSRLGVEFGIEQMRDGAKRSNLRTEFLYVIDGKLCIMMEEKNIVLKREDMFFINSSFPVTSAVLQPGILFRISVEPSVLEDREGGGYIEIDLDSTKRKETDLRYKQLHGYVIELIRSCIRKQDSDLFDQYSRCYLILGHLCKYFRKPNNPVSSMNASQKYTDEVVRIIWENYDKQITLQDIADRLYITNSHLSRVLKKNLGKNYREYINDVRLHYAVWELENSDKTILRIANDNGFSGLAIFNKSFKEAYGISPMEYRKAFHDKKKISGEIDETALQKVEDSLVGLNGEEVGIPEIKICAAAGKYAPYTKPWQDILNVGTAMELLNNKIQHHVLKIKKELGCKYVRFWGIFQDGFLIIPQSSGDQPNFNRLDDCINFLLSNDLKPFIQMGPKPRSIIRSLGNRVSGNNEHQRAILEYDERKWKSLVDAILSHLVIYYGEDEVNTWVFEMWNPYSWDNDWYKWFKPQMYADLGKAIKKYAPDALFGGGEFVSSMLPELPSKIRTLDKIGADQDFISFAMFPYKPDGVTLPELETNIHFVRDAIEEIRNMMEQNGIVGKKLYLTIWNNTISSRNILNDTVYRGAYIIKNAIDTIGKVDQICFWQCTDAFTEDFDSDGILHGGAGIMTKDGFFKPAAYAFIFLKRLYSRLIKKGDYFAVTTNGYGSYAIIYHNLKSLVKSIYLRREDQLKYEDLHEVFADNIPIKLKFEIKDMMDGIYNIRFHSVDKYNGSILDEWKGIGGYVEMPEEDKVYLEKVSLPKRHFARKDAAGGVMDLEVEVPANGFGLIEITLRK